MKRLPAPESPLIYWAREREKIRKRKATGDLGPWSCDPILNQYRFCNLRRRDDRVSQWLIRHVLQFYYDMDFWTFVQWSALCRWINWPPTLSAILAADEDLITYNSIDLPGIAKLVDARTKETKAWTGAYMVRAAPKRDYGVMPKGQFVCEEVVGEGLANVRGQVYAALKMKQTRMAWAALFSAKNWGSFMAGQVVADWSYTPLLQYAGDIVAWAPQGPGSVRGYNRLLGLPLKTKGPPEEVWCDQLKVWRHDIIEALGPEYVDLTLMDVQNALCETDKYLRVKYGEGRPRATYKPETRF